MVIKSLQKVFLGVMLLLLCGLGNSAKASHVAAGDIYLDYIGTGPTNLKYRITLVVFKACEPNNAGLGPSETVNFSSSCGSHPSLNLPMTQGPDTLDQLCDNKKDSNSCRYPTSIYPGFERRIYSAETTLPFACVDWKVTWSLCCRNSGVLNLQNPGGESLYIETGINNVTKYDNSTPRFIIDPIPYLCVNQQAVFLNGPFDPDNDSVVSANAWPWGGANLNIPYQAPYNNVNPFDSPNGYSVNPNTATAMFTPPVIGKFVMAFTATDYERGTGTYLSHTRRDVQVSVLQCAAAPPAISTSPQSITGGGWNGTQVLGCPGTELKFDVSSQTTSGTNAVILVSNNTQVIPASTFTVANQNTSNPVGTFTWTPTVSDIGEYTVIFTAKDSTCNNNQPIILNSYFVAFIKIQKIMEAGPDGSVCEIGGSPFEINVDGPPGTVYLWSANDNSNPPTGLIYYDSTGAALAKPPYNMVYYIHAPAIPAACKNMDTVQVWLDTTNNVQILPGDAVFCRPGYFQLDAQGSGPSPYRNLECGTWDIQNCTQEDTLAVASQASGGVITQNPAYTPFPAARTAKLQFLLTKSDLYYYGVRAGTVRGLAFDVTSLPTPASQVYNNFTISLKCTDRRNLSAATGGMESGMTQVYSAPAGVPVTIGWNQFTFDTPFSHDSTKGLIVEICYSNATAGTMPALVNAVTTSSQQTVYSYANTGTGNICQNPAVGTNTDYHSARPIIRLNYCPTDSVPYVFTWFPGDFLSDSTQKSPLAYIPKTSTFHVSTYGRNGCIIYDTATITVPIHVYDVWPNDTLICYGSKFRMIASGDFATIKWYEGNSFGTATNVSCDDCREPMATAVANTIYKAVLTDKDGCSDTFTVNVVVKPLPIVNIMNRDTVLKYGQSIQLLASGSFLYSWSPIASLSNPNIVNPLATPTEPTTYYVSGLAENGCRNTDSIHIDIDYRDNLYVPSAFTPNGDGKNDVFRVSNITFQKLQEFRVFNRWGQEIFSTTDARKGWDGSWKGVPQDMGSYHYLIRVAYPDGFIETYKGDVTLVR